MNEHLFFSTNHARAVIAGWVDDYDTARPHSAIGYMTPAAYAASLKPQRAAAPRHLGGSAPTPVATVAHARNSKLTIPVCAAPRS
jgi:putative transposase